MRIPFLDALMKAKPKAPVVILPNVILNRELRKALTRYIVVEAYNIGEARAVDLVNDAFDPAKRHWQFRPVEEKALDVAEAIISRLEVYCTKQLEDRDATDTARPV